jgi:outer membrane protein OmpA-like peptidoglycan-associated protein
VCGLLSASGVEAKPLDGIQLAQADQTNDKNKDDGDKKDKKDRGGKGQDKGREGKGGDREGREGKGPPRSDDRGPRDRKNDRPDGPPKRDNPPQQQPKEDKAPPQQQPERKPPKVEKQQPSSSFDRFRQKNDQPPKNEPKREDQKREEQKGRPSDDGRNAPPKVESKPPAVKPQQPSSSYDRFRQPNDQGRKDDRKDDRGNGGDRKDAGRNDNDRRDNDRRDNDRRDVDRRDGDGRDRGWNRDGDRGPPGSDQGRPERGRWSGGKPPAPSEARDLNDLKSRRRERSEDGGRRVIIEEPDKRRIVREGGRSIIRHDETERFRRIAPDTRIERRDGLNISVSILPGGIRIYTDLDNDGRPLRRYRRGPDGRDVVLFDNRDYYRRSRGGSFLDAIIDLPPPRLRIPRDRYIVEYDRASYEDVYDALYDGPVDNLDRGYSLEEVRRSPMLRDRMRRIDLDTVNFDFGSWTVDYNQYGAFERLARAMNRIIDRNPGEMFFIEGHTDAVGSDEDNLSLSDRRAESVAIILTEEFGVPPENLTTQGYGEQYLKVPTDGPERLNRRVTVLRATPLLAR